MTSSVHSTPPSDPNDPATQVRRLREHLRRRPGDGAAWLALAQLLSRQAPGPELHHALEQAIQCSPASSDAWLLAARVHQRQRGNAAARQWLAHWSRQNPELAAPRTAAALLQAEAARQAGQWPAALALYREAEKDRPEDPVLLNDIGGCLASLEAYDEAEPYFRNALKLLPGFPEARLNLAFLRACLGQDEEALEQIAALLDENRIAGESRRGAESLRAVLLEHGRLAPVLHESVHSGSVGELQAALDLAPAPLSEPHDDSVDRLRHVAESCRALAPAPAGGQQGTAGSSRADRVEAAILCNVGASAEALKSFIDRVERNGGEPAPGSPECRYEHALQAIRDRRGHGPAPLQGPAGEAWLRYWHARLLADEPRSRPGQFKLASNAIRGLPLTPAEHAVGTLRLALRECLPGVPNGRPRGLFLYVAVNMIHAFADGNGRLARFLLAWETSAAGSAPLLVPVDSRQAVAQALDVAWLGGDVAPLAEALETAGERAEALLMELRGDGRRPDGNGAPWVPVG